MSADADSLEIWEAAWAERDSSKQKSFGMSELRELFLSFGKDLSQNELKEVCQGKGSCTLDQFTSYMTSLTVHHTKPGEIRHAIHTLNHSGNQARLKTSELRVFLTSHGDRLNNNEAATLVSDADPTACGFVDVEQLCNIIAN